MSDEILTSEEQLLHDIFCGEPETEFYIARRVNKNILRIYEGFLAVDFEDAGFEALLRGYTVIEIVEPNILVIADGESQKEVIA